MNNNLKVTIRILLILIILLSIDLFMSKNTHAARISVKIGVNYNLPPFQYLDNEGEIVGLHIDIMNEIARRENLIIEYIPFKYNSKAEEALNEGLIDIILGAQSNSKSSSDFQFTNDITSSSLCMLVRNEDISRFLNPEKDPRRYTAAFELGTIRLSQLSQLNSMSFVIMGNQTQLFNALRKKNIDAMIGVKDSIIYLLEETGDSSNYTIVHNYIASINYSMIVRNNDHALYNSLNRGIIKLRASDTYEKLLDKWISNIELEAAREMSKKMLTYIVLFVLVASVIMVIIVYINYSLKKLVSEKTREIRKRVQQLENESVLRERIIEIFPSGIMLLKEDGSLLMMNSIIRNIADINNEDEKQINGNISELNVLSDIWRRTESGKTTLNEKPLVFKINSDGSRIFRYRCQNINAENDKLITVEDITEEEEEKQEIFELRKTKALNRIVAGMAHEIKNPLTSISTFASLIKQQGDDEEFQALFAQHVPSEIERIKRLIDMLINYARPIRRDKDRVLISELINDSIGFAQISAKSKKLIKFETKILKNGYLYVNRDQIKQSLINLILNSIESVENKLSNNENMYPNGLSIGVFGYSIREKICLEVYDEGGGMTESDVEKCTDPFFTTKKSGLGMGLALTKQFINENSGKIEFESRLGEYTKIRIIFEEDKTNEAICVNNR